MLIYRIFEMKILFSDQDWSILPQYNLNSGGLSVTKKSNTKLNKTKPNRWGFIMKGVVCFLSYD